MRILIIEDEVRLADNIAQFLRESSKYAVDVCYNGTEGCYMALANPYDLIILDWMLPGIEGIEILAKMRKKAINIPVLMLTARDCRQDIINALDCGSDDYMCKPFDLDELQARCRALIRRSFGVSNPKLICGPIEIDPVARRVTVASTTIELPVMEYRTLEYLMFNKGKVVSKEAILEHLYDFNWEKFSNVIEVYISNIRKKTDPDKKYNLIKTLRGHGYLMSEVAD